MFRQNSSKQVTEYIWKSGLTYRAFQVESVVNVSFGFY